MIGGRGNPPGHEDPEDEIEEEGEVEEEDDRYPEDIEVDDSPAHNYHNYNPSRGW